MNMYRFWWTLCPCVWISSLFQAFLTRTWRNVHPRSVEVRIEEEAIRVLILSNNFPSFSPSKIASSWCSESVMVNFFNSAKSSRRAFYGFQWRWLHGNHSNEWMDTNETLFPNVMTQLYTSKGVTPTNAGWCQEQVCNRLRGRTDPVTIVPTCV